MNSFQTIHQRIREIGYFRYFGGCLAAGIFVYALALIFVLGVEVMR